MKNDYFIVMRDCIIVDGVLRSTICDLSRNQFDIIPLGLSEILQKCSGMRVFDILKKYTDLSNEIFQEYVDFLLDKEYIILSPIYIEFPTYYTKVLEPFHVTNFIFDFDENSNYDLNAALSKIHGLGVNAICFRFYHEISITDLHKKINIVNKLNFDHIELLLQYSEEYSNTSMLQSFVSSINNIVYIGCANSPEENHVSFGSIMINFLTTKFDSEACCGKISPSNFQSNTKYVLQSLTTNNCLSNKLSVDKFGFIKKCPSLEKSMGHIDEISDINGSTQFYVGKIS